MVTVLTVCVGLILHSSAKVEREWTVTSKADINEISCNYMLHCLLWKSESSTRMVVSATHYQWKLLWYIQTANFFLCSIYGISLPVAINGSSKYKLSRGPVRFTGLVYINTRPHFIGSHMAWHHNIHQRSQIKKGAMPLFQNPNCMNNIWLDQ